MPKTLEQAVAIVLGNGKKRQPWLQRSLRTKDKQEAKRLAPPVLMEFDRVLAQAEGSTCGKAVADNTRPSGNPTHRGLLLRRTELASDDETRREGGSETLFENVSLQLARPGCVLRDPTASTQCPSPASLIERWTKSINRLRSFCRLHNARSQGATSRLCVGRSTSFSSSLGSTLTQIPRHTESLASNS